MSERPQFIVLCEDLQSQVFLCRALVQGGANPRRIRRVALPSVAGGGQNASVKTGLVVHIEADPTHTVAQRHARRRTVPAAAGAVPSLLDGIVELRRLP